MPKATKRERQRQNREARRAAMQAEEKRRRRFKSIRLFVIILAAAVALAFVVSLTRDDGSDSSDASTISCTNKKPDAEPTNLQAASPPAMSIDPSLTYDVVMHTSCGSIPMTLDAATAPQTVNSFVSLADEGFYDGTNFHRLVKDFVDQGGDPTGTGTGGPGYTLPDEPPSGPYQKGDVAMANAGAGTTGSQFFLVVSDNGAKTLTASGTPGKYSILGHMDKQGLKVAQKINSFAGPDEKPTRPIYVFSVDVTPSSGASSSTTAAPTSTTAAP